MRAFLPLLFLFLAPITHAGDFIHIAPEQLESLGIQTAPVQPAGNIWGSPYPAQVRVPNAQLMVISAPQDGLLTRLEVAEGDAVRKGMPLAYIQSPKLVEAQRLYLEAVSRLSLARAALERDRKLKAEGIIAERRYLETRARYAQARTEVEQRRQALKLAGMAETALRELEKSHRLSATIEVRSPMDGVVLEQLAEPGQRVEIATPLYRIGRLEPLWLEIQVPLEKLEGIQPGTLVKIDKAGLEGRIVTIGSRTHGQSQTVLVRAEISHPNGRLRPGQFVEARLARTSEASAWRVPRQALLRVNGNDWILVSRKGGFKPVRVQMIAEEPEALVVEAPLSPDDQVAVSGTAALKAAWLEGQS